MALTYLSSKSPLSQTSSREICESLNIPLESTAKILQKLNKNGWLNAIQGPKGGYQLSISLKEKSLVELVDLIEGNCHLVNCSEGNCELMNTCNVATPLKKLDQYLRSFLSSLSLDEILRESSFNPQLKEKII